METCLYYSISDPVKHQLLSGLHILLWKEFYVIQHQKGIALSLVGQKHKNMLWSGSLEQVIA